MSSTILNNLTLILPELVLTATALLVIVAHLIDRKNETAIYFISLVGLVATLYTLSSKVGQNLSAFDGMLSVDPFSLFFKIVIVLTTIVVVSMSRHSEEVKNEKHLLGEYYFLVISMAIGMMFMVSSSNLLMMYLTLELTSLTSYIASGFTRKAKDSSEASLKYLLYGAFSSGVMLYGISILYGLTGTLSIAGINQVIMQGSVNGLALVVSSLFILVGFAYKISAVPFHYWTPDVYEGAPITITAFLSVASKAAGFAMMMRAFKVMFIDSSVMTLPAGVWTFVQGIHLQNVLIVLSVVTMTLGNLVALWQDNLKRMLAYSSIAQAGFMLMAIVALNSFASEGILLYAAAYSLATIGLFAILVKMKDYTFEGFNGFAKHQPLLAATAVVFLLSLAGIPLTAGFLAKFYMVKAVISQGGYLWLVILAMLMAAISVYYYFRVIQAMYFKEGEAQVLEVSTGFKWTISLVAALVILLGIFPQLLFSWLYF